MSPLKTYHPPGPFVKIKIDYNLGTIVATESPSAELAAFVVKYVFLSTWQLNSYYGRMRLPLF